MNAIRGSSLPGSTAADGRSEWEGEPHEQRAFAMPRTGPIEAGAHGEQQTGAPDGQQLSSFSSRRRGTGSSPFRYSLEEDGYANRDLTVFAAHLFEDKNISPWCYQQKPWSPDLGHERWNDQYPDLHAGARRGPLMEPPGHGWCDVSAPSPVTVWTMYISVRRNIGGVEAIY